MIDVNRGKIPLLERLYVEYSRYPHALLRGPGGLCTAEP